MNILNIDLTNIEGTGIEESAEKIVDPVILEIPDDLPGSPEGQGFGSVDMWRLRGGRKDSGSQQSTDRFSI